MFLDPQIDVDMTRIGCRISIGNECNLCKGCYNRRRCIHLERWKKVKQERERIFNKIEKHHLRGGVCGQCKPGYNDIGLICSRPMSCRTWGDDCAWKTLWGSCVWGLRTECRGDESYGKCNDQIRGFFEQVSDKLKEVFGPNGPLAQIFDPRLNGVAAAFEQLGQKMADAFDPEKNGVAAAFRKFGDDVEKAFKEIGDKIKDFFVTIGNSIVEGMRAFGELLSQFGDSMKDFFSDPQNIIGLMATILSGIGSVLPPPLSNLMGVLSAATTIIGNAVIGAPFDPTSLVDLAGAFVLPPQGQLAKNIAKDVAKAATITAKIATKVTSTGRNCLKAVNTAAKNFGKMSAADKAFAVGKATAKVGGKAAMYVGKKSVAGLGPIGATQSAGEQAADDELGEDLNEEQADPQRDVNAKALEAQMAQDDFDKNLWATEFGGTEAGALAVKDQKQREAIKKQYTDPVSSLTNEQVYGLATGDPQSFTNDEKFYWYSEVVDDKKAIARTNATKTAQGVKEKVAARKVEEAKAAVARATTPRERYEANLALQNAQVESTSQADKDAEEMRRFGLTFAQAKSLMKQYQDEINIFMGKSSGNGKRHGGFGSSWQQSRNRIEAEMAEMRKGVEESVKRAAAAEAAKKAEDDKKAAAAAAAAIVAPTPPAVIPKGTDDTQSIVPTPDYFPEDKVNRGEELYGVPLFPAVVTPTFFHFAKVFPVVPQLRNPTNWFNEYNNFRKAYDQLKSDYNSLVETNEEAIHARNSQPMSKLDKLYQDYLAKPAEERDPINMAPNMKAKGTIAYLNFIENMGFSPESWNDLVASLNRKDLSVEEPEGEDDRRRKEVSRELIPPLPQEFSVPDGEEFRKKIGDQKPPSPWAGKKTGGNVLIQPPKEAILSYYRKIMGEQDPEKVFTEDELMKRFEIDWKTQPAVTATTIRSNSIQHNQDLKTGRGRRRSFSDFFGLKGGNTLTTDAKNNVSAAELRKKLPEAAAKMAMTLWTEQLPKALTAYLAANPKDKLLQRQSLRSLIAYGDMAYGPIWRMKENEPVFFPRQSFEDDVAIRAPEIYGEGDPKTPDEVAAEKKATTGTTPLKSGSGAVSGLDVPATQVMENLWLGNKDDAQNAEWLKKHNIHAVFNCTKDVDFAPGVKQYRFPIDDHEDDVEKMTYEAPKVVKRILKEMERGPVLVHCVEGRQRSPAVVALTMWIKKQGTGGAIRRELKKLRPIVFTPRATFEDSLQRWMN